MVAEWRRRRSLAAFGLHASDKLNRVRRSAAGDREDLLGRIAGIMAADPSIGPAEMRRRLLERDAAAPAAPTVRLLMMDARRRLAPGLFGERILFDSVGLDLVHGEGLRMRLFVALDAGTGLALGWADGTSRSGALGLAEAASDALGRLAGLDLDGFGMASQGPVADIRLQADDAIGRRTFERALGGGATKHGERAKLGSALIEALGPRLDRVWLGVGEREDGIGYRLGKRVHLPEYTDRISIAMDAAIERHNEGRLALASMPSAEAASVQAARSRVAELLRRVKRCGDELLAAGDYGLEALNEA